MYTKGHINNNSNIMYLLFRSFESAIENIIINLLCLKKKSNFITHNNSPNFTIIYCLLLSA